MRIGELAARTRVSVRALRYYEEQRLLSAERSAAGQRLYPSGAVKRVELIQQLYAAGLSSNTIRMLLPCVDTPGSADVPHSHDLLHRERDRIDAEIASLVRTRETLDVVLVAARSCGSAATPSPTEQETRALAS